MSISLGKKSRRITITAVAVGSMLALAACSSSGSTSPTSSTAATSNNGGSGNGNNSGTGNGGGSSSSRLSNLSNTLRNAQGATFKATYSTNYGGNSQTMTFAQQPPKSYFAIAGSQIIDTGTTTYYCSSSGAVSCFTASAQNPLAGLLNVFSPKAAISSLEAARSAVAGRVAGYDVSFTSQTFAGQPSSCVAVKASTGSAKYCITNSGVLAYESTGASQVFQLTSYSSSVSPSDFSLPAGATVVTLPAG
jgi:hypothetical protein